MMGSPHERRPASSSTGQRPWLRMALGAVLSCLIVTGCACLTPKPSIAPTQAPGEKFPEFVAVVAGRQDTLSSLAKQYLGDSSLDWFIADVNGVTAVTPGRELIIPLKPYDRGGLAPEGLQTVPVLCYHQFSENDIDKMTVSKRAFEEQMKFLKDRGYRVIRLDQLLDFMDFKTQIPKKSVVITIDDGWRSVYDIAYPILKQYGYPATLFTYTDLIVGGSKTLNWDMIREMSRHGIDIQCHSKTHRDLTKTINHESFQEYFEAMKKELIDSAVIIANHTDKKPTYFAYPYGETDSFIIALAGKAGYRGAFTVHRGGNPFFTDAYRIRRSMIYGQFTLQDFERNLRTFTAFSLR
jgi:peptidoglycan/xylan/chitin deacetylase (PgdA/CDA1 family)